MRRLLNFFYVLEHGPVNIPPRWLFEITINSPVVASGNLFANNFGGFNNVQYWFAIFLVKLPKIETKLSTAYSKRSDEEACQSH